MYPLPFLIHVHPKGIHTRLLTLVFRLTLLDVYSHEWLYMSSPLFASCVSEGDCS